MKKVFALICILSTALIFSSCGVQEQPSRSISSADTSSLETSTPTVTVPPSSAPGADSAVEPEEPKESTAEEGISNILVAYFSRMGNMDFDENIDATTSASVNMTDSGACGNAQLLAQMAQEMTGGDLFFIETTEKYPAGYRDTTNQANVEKSEDSRPELANHVENMDSYNTVILVYPNWWGGLPQAVVTFLEEYDFDGKIIYPLCTHEGSGLSNTESDIAGLCPGATVSEGLSVRGGDAASAQNQVAQWLSALQKE